MDAGTRQGILRGRKEVLSAWYKSRLRELDVVTLIHNLITK